MLGYGVEQYLETALEAAAGDLSDEDELILVDNGITDAAARRLTWPARTKVIGTGDNTGFAGGCRVGVAASSGAILIFVNSDAIVRPGAFDALAAEAADASIGLAGGCLRLAAQPELVNSAGNPLHFTGITWAGHCGEPASEHQGVAEVAVATGGLFAMRRAVWDELEGFDPLYFAYHEDTDLSIRAWLGGWRVIYVPTAIADHHYEFGRSPLKMYLVERNRLITVLTDFPAAQLARVLPAMLVVEPLLLVQSILQRWSAQKVRSWWWCVRNAAVLARRRRRVQGRVTRPHALDDLFISRIEPPMVTPPPGMGLVNAGLEAYWRAVRPRLGSLV